MPVADSSHERPAAAPRLFDERLLETVSTSAAFVVEIARFAGEAEGMVESYIFDSAEFDGVYAWALSQLKSLDTAEISLLLDGGTATSATRLHALRLIRVGPTATA